jgi:rubrerythrin
MGIEKPWNFICKQENIMKKFENLAEILAFAISMEQAAYDFYIELSRRAKTEAMKRVFLDFSEQEKGHKERILRIMGVAETVILDTTHQEKVAKYISAVPDADDMTYEKAIKTAINKEHAAMMLYQILAKFTEHKELRDVLEWPLKRPTINVSLKKNITIL